MVDILSSRINVEKYELLSDFNNLLEIKNTPSLLKEKKGLLSRIFGFK